jgi:hypothetical protein
MSDLNEALTAANAAALVQKKIDPVLVEYQRRYSPLVRTLPSKKWSTPVYYFNKRTQFPSGGFVTDGGARGVSTSSYVQENFQIRLLQAVGSVTGYANAVASPDDSVGALRAKEIEGANQGLLWDIENAIVWGASAPTLDGPYPQFDGLDILCSVFSPGSTQGPGIGGGSIDNYGGASTWGAPNFTPWTDTSVQNAIDAAGAGMSLGLLDALIDLVESNASAPVETSDYFFLMSPTAEGRLSQLLVNQQRFQSVEVVPGLIVNTYRNVPIIKSSFLSPRRNQMGVVTAAAGGVGTLNSTVYYSVAPVMARFGEIQGSTPVSFAATTEGVKLSFATPTGPDGALPLHYKVYRGVSATNTALQLIGIVDANFLDVSGNTWSTTSITDTGSALVPSNGGNVPAITPTTYYYGNANLHPLTSNGEQSIFLLSRDEQNVVRPYVRDMQPVDLYATTSAPDSLPFAIVSDTTLAVRGAKWIGRLANVQASIDLNVGNGVIPTTTTYTPSPYLP